MATETKSKKDKKSTASAARSITTTDHEEIKNWAEERDGKPATVKTDGDEVGILRIDFPGYSGGDTLEEITWDEFFKKFEDSKLEFLYQEETSRGKQSRFNKFVSRK